MEYDIDFEVKIKIRKFRLLLMNLVLRNHSLTDNNHFVYIYIKCTLFLYVSQKHRIHRCTLTSWEVHDHLARGTYIVSWLWMLPNVIPYSNYYMLHVQLHPLDNFSINFWAIYRTFLPFKILHSLQIHTGHTVTNTKT